ncbi:mCG146907 [Mus musculus]|nr:mCG146907 [Mus musculus]
MTWKCNPVIYNYHFINYAPLSLLMSSFFPCFTNQNFSSLTLSHRGDSIFTETFQGEYDCPTLYAKEQKR